MPPDPLPGQPAPPLLPPTIPAAGIIGTAALREAADGSYQDIINRLREAVSALFASRPGYADVLAVFPDTTVVAVSEPGRVGRIWSYPYTLEDGRAVTLGTPVEMVETFAPIASRLREAAGGVLAADHPAGPDGTRFAVRVIRAGMSGNGNYYPDAVLRKAVPLFEGVRVFVKSDAEHLRGGGKDVRGLIGKITGVRFVEGAAPDRGEVLGTLSVIDPAEAIAVKLREAASRDMADLFGLSVDAEGTVRGGTVAGRPIKTATAITRVRSVDLIVEPGAGGAVISLIEALADPAPASLNKDDAMLRQHLIATILATRPDLLNGVADLAALTDDALTGLFRESLANPPASNATPGAVTDEVRRLVEAQMQAVTQTIAARQMARDRIARSRLPQRAKDRLAAEFEARADFREADVDARIADEVAYLAPAAGGGTVADLGDASLILMGESRADKFREALGAFWDPEHKDHRHAQSLKDLYVLATGDKRVTGRVADCDRALLREALDGDDFASVFADSLNKRMQRVYGAYREPDVYLDLVEIVDVRDFRQQSRVAWGGYGDLPEVAKNDPYMELDSPQEADPATYRIKKRGRLESIALEDIQNDDVGMIRRIPVDLGRASKRTLGKFVLDFLRTNPLVMDGKPLFHADHGNLITDPLGGVGYDKLRLLMKGQMDIGGHDKIGVNPKFLWVPDKLEAVAYDLFTLNQRNDPDFITTLKPTIRPVWYWTDPTDWCVSADPQDIPTLELGFLNGQREPEIFVQDSPTGGSLFANDQITWKVRHIYGGTVLDWRGLGKSEVSD